MAETVNLPRDSTLRELVAVQKASIIASGNAAAIDRLYGSLVRAAKSVEEVNILFVDWWNICWKEGVTTRNELCGRWFGTVLDDNRVHGTKEPLFATSQSAIGEATDDSVGLVCTPSTEAAANRDDFAKLPQFWALEVAAEKNADGTHTIYAVEFIDSYDDVRRSKHLCWVLQKNTYTKEWDEGGYRYFKMRCHPSTGYETWPQGTDKNGTVYGYIANPKYAAGFDSDGLIGCGSGRPPINYSSHSDNVGLWRKRGAQYAGASGELLKWQLAMIRLKYARKGNSGTIEGCTGYSYQYAVSVGESGVKRVLLTAAQAANLFVGSSVIIGDKEQARARIAVLPACTSWRKTNALPASRTSPSTARPTRRSTSRRTPPLTPKRASPTSPRCPIGAAGTILCRAMMAADTARQVARNRALSSARSSKMARI